MSSFLFAYFPYYLFIESMNAAQKSHNKRENGGIFAKITN